MIATDSSFEDNISLFLSPNLAQPFPPDALKREAQPWTNSVMKTEDIFSGHSIARLPASNVILDHEALLRYAKSKLGPKSTRLAFLVLSL